MTATAVQSKITALNRYARNGDDANICWGTLAFARTFKAVQKEAKEQLPHMAGATLDWRPCAPSEISVFKDSFFNGGQIASFNVPVEGAVADALLEDMQAVAFAFAEKCILEERQRALEQEARDRVLALMADI